jgi:hypothetical protein
MLVVAWLLACGTGDCAEGACASGGNPLASARPVARVPFEGVVVERIDVGSYSYLRLVGSDPEDRASTGDPQGQGPDGPDPDGPDPDGHGQDPDGQDPQARDRDGHGQDPDGQDPRAQDPDGQESQDQGRWVVGFDKETQVGERVRVVPIGVVDRFESARAGRTFAPLLFGVLSPG